MNRQEQRKIKSEKNQRNALKDRCKKCKIIQDKICDLILEADRQGFTLSQVNIQRRPYAITPDGARIDYNVQFVCNGCPADSIDKKQIQ